ncbi:uncharacterized protein [Montipora capricornis]|uniref:uncharacterized protein n=1 Tax=Montipora capricornis TaxID=246305 RepID=UPI0035F189CE
MVCVERSNMAVNGGFFQSCGMGYSMISYCPETVLVHCAFLLADKEAGLGLAKVEKGNCRQVILIVSDSIREITARNLQADGHVHKLHQTKIKQLEFQIHSWVFSSFLKGIGFLDPDNLPEDDCFHCLPPLPPFNVEFYLDLLHEMGWEELLVEGLCTSGLENITSPLEEIINCVSQRPSFKDLLLFNKLICSLLLRGKEHSASDIQDTNLDYAPLSCGIMLLIRGVRNLAKDYSCWPEGQEDILKSVIDFTFETLIVLSKMDFLLKTNENNLSSFYAETTTNPSSNMKSHHCDHIEMAHSDVISARVVSSMDLLYQLIVNDWKATMHWTRTEVCNVAVDLVDCSSWHSLHKWIVKVYSVSCWLVSHPLDSTSLEQATELQTGFQQYLKIYSVKADLVWMGELGTGDMIDLKECCIKEEFIPPFDSVDLLLFQPESTREQFDFYLQQVNNHLDGYKECFDWLLSAEEFHQEPSWLECMRNHSIQLSDIQHVLKMIDIIYMQRQQLCSGDESSDVVYSGIKEILLSLFPTLSCSAQQQIIEYAFFMNSTSKCPDDEDSLFFHPHFVKQEWTSFQQDLIIVFNKLLDISTENQLQSAVLGLARAFLVSPHQTLKKAIHDGVKSMGHSQSICTVLRKLPVVTLLKSNASSSSQTLLCQAIKSEAMTATSRQLESNLLNMISLMLSEGSSESLPLLSLQELMETTVLCFLNNMNLQGHIPTSLAVKLLNTSMTAVKPHDKVHQKFLKKHLLAIILCLCELLNECTAYWDGLAPIHSLSDMEELRELELNALDSNIKLCCDVLETSPSFSRSVEWLLKRVKSCYGWTIPLYLRRLLSAAYVTCKIPVPCCLLDVCDDTGEEWVADKDLPYGNEDVFTVIFEYCRVSESTLQSILGSLLLNRLSYICQDIRKHVVVSMAQILPHCTRKEWTRILDLCMYLTRRNILEVSFPAASFVLANDKVQEVSRICTLLLDMLKTLSSPLCSSWATPLVWGYVIRHYISVLKDIVDESTDVAVTLMLFAHVCHAMTFVPADCDDHLFILALDLVSKPSRLDNDVTELLKLSINSLSSDVYKTALLQKLYL